MNNSGEAAEQVVRMSLDGVEVAARLSGAAAKQIAVMLYAILRDQKKTRGKTRLTGLLRSGKELKVFAVQDGDLQRFCQEAKKYGVLYCVLKDKNAKDGLTDIMVRAEDASKINRIFERFKLASVDMAAVRTEVEKSLEKAHETGVEPPEKGVQEKAREDQFLDELMKTPNREAAQTQNPTQGSIVKSPQSEPTLQHSGKSERGTSDMPARDKPSVRQELNDIRAEQKEKAAAAREESAKDKSGKQKTIQHKTPEKKPKQKKAKEM